MYNTDLADALVQYNLHLRQLYNIYLRATTTTILGLRGVTILIILVSSATDSVWRSIVLFKFVLSPYSDLKSEFLCQSSLSCTEPADPLNPPHMPGISPMPSNTTYHPYSHNPSALTEYLKQKLHQQRAKHLSHSHPAQVEQNIPLKHNINSDFTLAATTVEYLDRRGEHNVPKRYLKEADWCKDGPLGQGYYVADLDNPAILIAVDFNFKYLQWGCTHPKKDQFVFEQPAPARYRLRIFDKERTPDRSHWGPLDGSPDEEEIPDPRFKFGSKAGEDTPDPNVVIPKSQQELDLAAITQLIPAHISKPPIQPQSLAGAMAQITSTTTLTDSLVARTLGTGVSPGGNTTSAEGILRTLFPSQNNQGDGGGDDPPEPHQRDTGKHKEGGSGGGGGEDDPNPSDGGGGGGSGPNPAGGGHAADPGTLLDKMIGNELEIFTGDRDKVEEFMTSWSVYHGINKQTRVMNNNVLNYALLQIP